MSARAVARPRENRSPRYPGTEEIRMVRSIAHHGLRFAAKHGEYHATFRGFRVQAIRLGMVPSFNGLVEVSVSVSFAGFELEREKRVAADADMAEPKPSAGVIALGWRPLDVA